ncbi:MAG: lysophospholipid acyltransferase family protein [Puia sp.]|nr:lysophospholipid acyltransferase family protein [Puia sp.]
MKQLDYTNSNYLTKPEKISLAARLLPSLGFYCRFIEIVIRASKMARLGLYDNEKWYESSFDVLKELEKIGICFHISGIDHLREVEGPCVIIGNHMSLMESVVLPVIIGPVKAITFIIKEGLLRYPVFQHIMRSRNPIAVTRTNPRHDFQTVMEEGVDRLKKGISIIVFPQTTRSSSFDPEQMSTIGVKLAKKAGVPIIPLALRTSAWKNGKIIKDFGVINVSESVRFSFGAPLRVQGKGADEHQAVARFIEDTLNEWGTE